MKYIAFIIIKILFVIFLQAGTKTLANSTNYATQSLYIYQTDSLLSDGRVLLHGRIKNYSGSTNLITIKFSNITTNAEEVHSCTLDGKGQFSIEIPLSHYVSQFQMLYGAKKETFMAYPGDTVGVYLDCANPHESGVFFSGNRKKLQDELRKFSVYFMNARTAYEDIHNVRNLDEKAFKNYRSTVKMKDDSVTNAYLAVYHVTPELQQIAMINNQYSWARDLVAYSFEHAAPSFTKLEQSYFDFIDSKILDNPKALLSPEYIKFISLYEKQILLANNRQNMPIVDAVSFALANDHSLNPNARSIFKKFSSSKGVLDGRAEVDSLNKYIDNDFINRFNQAYLIDLNFKKLDSAMNNGIGKQLAFSIFLYEELSNRNIIEDSILYKFSLKVNNQILQRAVFKTNSALSGKVQKLQAASSFSGQKISSEPEKTLETILSKYKGKVVYVDFWATWCQPCLHEMKNSAATKEKFKDVIFLYLCEKSPDGRWKFIVQDQEVKGEHYLLSSPQSDYLSRKFSIYTIPRYMVIDQYGQIINDRAPSPSSADGLKLLNDLQANK